MILEHVYITKDYVFDILRSDLGNDVLNIIGDYVKKDNIERMEKEKMIIVIEGKIMNLNIG